MSGGAARSGGRVCGVDVQERRGCPFVVLEPARRAAKCVATGWLDADSPAELGGQLAAILERHGVEAAGIDAPRQPLPAPRRWGVTRGRWEASPRDLVGRHCEVVIASSRVARPQWTPLETDAPPWMRRGFALFEAAVKMLGERVHEVFPSASYRLLAGDERTRFELACGDFSPGPKDLLDAAMAAVTVLEYRAGRGAAVGGGDGLGTIVLPRPLPQPPQELLHWPG